MVLQTTIGGMFPPFLCMRSKKMGVTAIVAIAVGVLVAGAVMDRGNTNPGFKAEQHKTMNDPSKSES